MSDIRKYCAIHIAAIAIISIIANFAMVIHMWKTRKSARKVDPLFAALGLSNFSLSAFFIFRVLVHILLKSKGTDTDLDQIVLSGMYGVFCTQNQLINIGIAYSRYCAVLQPLKYSKEKERSRLLKRLMIISIVISCVIGASIAFITAVTQGRVVRNWIDCSLRLLTYVLLCIIYVKIFCKVKAHNHSVAITTGIRNEERDSSIRERTAEHQKYLTKLFIGITVSFLVFNMPVMIIGTIIPVLSACDTTEGKLLTLAATFLEIGTAFDPFWYFFLWKRIKKKQPGQTHPLSNNA